MATYASIIFKQKAEATAEWGPRCRGFFAVAADSTKILGHIFLLYDLRIWRS